MNVCEELRIKARRRWPPLLGPDASPASTFRSRSSEWGGVARKTRIGNAEFVIADAWTHQFDAGTFDLGISQFGLTRWP